MRDGPLETVRWTTLPPQHKTQTENSIQGDTQKYSVESLLPISQKPRDFNKKKVGSSESPLSPTYRRFFLRHAWEPWSSWRQGCLAYFSRGLGFLHQWHRRKRIEVTRQNPHHRTSVVPPQVFPSPRFHPRASISERKNLLLGFVFAHAPLATSSSHDPARHLVPRVQECVAGRHWPRQSTAWPLNVVAYLGMQFGWQNVSLACKRAWVNLKLHVNAAR